MAQSIDSVNSPRTSKLLLLQDWLILAYAISLPLSLTASWILFLLGFSISLILLAWQIMMKKSLESPTSQDPANAQSDPDALPLEIKLQDNPIPPLSLPLLVMALCIAISGFFNPGQANALESALEAGRSVFSLKSLLPYFWAWFQFRRNPGLCKSALLLLLLISAVAGVWGSIQQVFDIHPTKFKYLQGTGFLGHPMAFAGQMQIFAFLGLGLLISGGFSSLSSGAAQIPSWLTRLAARAWFFVPIVACNFLGLFFAGERSAWLGSLVALLSVTFCHSVSLGLKVSSAGFLLFLFGWFNVPLLRTRMESMFSGQDISISVRQRIWSECLQKHFAGSPLVGIGWLKFPHFDIPEAIVPGVSKDLNHAHSNYVQFLSCSGLLGFGSYLYLQFCTFSLSWQKYRNNLSKDPFLSGLGLGIFGLSVSIAVSGLFEYNFGSSQVRLAQWFVLALL